LADGGRLFFPPGVLGAAEGLGDAIHGFTFGHGNGVIDAAIGVLPGGDYQQLVVAAEVGATLGGVVYRGEAIVFDDDDGIALADGCIDDVLLSFGNSGRDKDCAGCGGGKAAGLVPGEEGGILSMTDDGQERGAQKLAVAIAVAKDEIIPQFGIRKL